MQTQRNHTFFSLPRGRVGRLMMGIGAVFLIAFAIFPSAVHAGNDLVGVSLRVDLVAVNQAKDYVSSIFVGGIPSNGSNFDFTTAWFSVELRPNLTYFSQVGFMTNKYGPFWFVYSTAGVTCWQGMTWYGSLGCRGAYYDRATIGNWQKVEFVTYGSGYWIVRVYDQYGGALDVAAILYNDQTNAIYSATVTSEEGYPEATDPYLLASFWHSHPQYYVDGGGYPFADWPASSNGPASKRNWLQSVPSGVCPDHYWAILDWLGDPRVWYAGSTTQGPGVCTKNKVW